MKRFAFLVVALTIGTSALAQITITKSDVDAAYTQGATVYTELASGTNVNIGTAGAGSQSFDFNSYTFAPYTVSRVVSAASTPLADSFPGAQWAMVDTAGAQTVYNYFYVTSDGLYSLGLGMISGGTNVQVRRNSPAMLQTKLPMTMGTTWDYHSDTVVLGGGGGASAKQVTNAHYEVDSWGTLMVKGQSIPCLRLKSWQQVVNITSIPGMPPIINSLPPSFTFSFLTNGVASVAISVDSAQSGNSVVNPTGGQISSSSATPSGVFESMHPSISELTLYPNPTHGSAVASFGVASPSRVSVDVVDMLGRTVQNVARGMTGTGAMQVPVDCSTLPPGVYTLRVNANGSVIGHPVSVVK